MFGILRDTMNFTETLKLAFDAIWAHKLRSFLTLLGMIIGVTAFMVVLSLLQGFSNYFDEKVANIGSNAFSIRRFDPFNDFKDTDTIAAAQRRNKELTIDEFEFIRARAQTVDKMGIRGGSSRADIKRESQTLEEIQVDGATPEIAEIDNYDIAQGRFFTPTENEGAVNVAYVGSDIADKLFPFGGALGGTIDIRGISYRIIGIEATKGSVFGQPMDNFVRLPLKTYSKNFGGLTRQRGIYFVIAAKSKSLINDAVEETRSLLRIKRKLPAGEKDNFGVVTPDAIQNLRQRVFGPIATAILVIPAIALVVGGIVVMNIMLVAVTERTKEIGIRKSLGARQADILKQFLVESATLSLFGGLVGLTLAWLIGLIISKIFFATLIPVWAMFVGILIPAGIGVLAGIFPAWKAARLDPIEALRAD